MEFQGKSRKWASSGNEQYLWPRFSTSALFLIILFLPTENPMWGDALNLAGTLPVVVVMVQDAPSSFVV